MQQQMSSVNIITPAALPPATPPIAAGVQKPTSLLVRTGSPPVFELKGEVGTGRGLVVHDAVQKLVEERVEELVVEELVVVELEVEEREVDERVVEVDEDVVVPVPQYATLKLST